MKTTLEFALPEEEESFNTALKAQPYKSTLQELIIELSKLCYPTDPKQPACKHLEGILNRLEQKMQELKLD